MVRTVEKKYQVWLAGYYDDFNGARAIPDDENRPTDTSYSAIKSHFGNPMNGEAFINPRFRFSVEERTLDSAKKITTSANQYLQNNGIFEWLTFDNTRLSRDEWEGRAQLQYPDGHVANRYKFDNDSNYGSAFYQRFINGHNSNASYIVPVGDNDATFGHSDMKDYDNTNYNADNAGLHSTTGDFVQRAHLTGVWMGEVLQQDHTTTTPSNINQEIHSPSKQPFLCIQASRKADTNSATTPSIIYDGALNTRLDGDVFTARVALQSGITTGAWADVGIKFEIGFANTQAGLLNDTGYTGTPAIDYTLDLNAISYDTQAYLGGGSYNTPQVAIDDAWLDVDFVFDYTNNQFDVWVNGTSHATNQTMSGGSATTAANLYGYQLTVTNEGSSGTVGFISYLMLDRVGVVRYLTDDLNRFNTADEVQIINMNVKQTNNGISSCDVTVADDPKLTGSARGAASTDYILNLRNLFIATAPLDWNLLIFADTTKRIDRPVWRGEISLFNISEKERSRQLRFSAYDSMGYLDRQMPLWDIGQNGENTSESSTNYWSYDAQGFRNAMYLGADKLTLLDGNIGFDSDSSYEETSNQRTQLGSGHPIQMYNNEDVYGPNNTEDSYEGYPIDGFVQKASSTETIMIMKDSSHTITTSSPSGGVNIVSSNHTASSKTPSAVSGADIEFSAGTLAYSPEASKIVYMGKYPILRESERIDYYNTTAAGQRHRDWVTWNDDHPSTDDWGTQYLHKLYVYFDADPSLKSGDTFYINRRNDANSVNLTSSYNQKHRVVYIKKIRNYFGGTYGESTLNSTVSYLWVVRTLTDYSGSESHGVYAANSDADSDTLLSSTNRFSWSKDTGIVSNVMDANLTNIKNRAIHAQWMRDLPLSLWFRYHFGKINKDPKDEPPPYGQTGALSGTGTSSPSRHCRVMASQTLSPTTTILEVEESAFDVAPNAGVAEIWVTQDSSMLYKRASTFKEKFIYEGKVTVGGKWYLVGVRHINGTYAINASSRYSEGGIDRRVFLKFEDFEDDYKHLWLLWSDMRNSGDANADGSERKVDFGLQYPLNDNYNFDLYFTDQVDENGNIDKFGNLNVGEDLDVWNVDSTSDPFTGGAFSKPVDYTKPTTSAITLDSNSGSLRVTLSGSDTTSGLNYGDYVYLTGTASHDGLHTISSKTSTAITTSTTFASATQNLANTARAYPVTGSEDNFSHYQDWEDKAGSFLVIDAARFFNLNTHINGGKTGQFAGGRTDLTDYIVEERSGHPTLIDNYWTEAIASYQNTGTVARQHENQNFLISDVTVASLGFIDGYKGLPVHDASIFDTSGVGKLITVYSQNRNEGGNDLAYFKWEGKVETEEVSAGSSDATIDAVSAEGADSATGETVVTIQCLNNTHDTNGVTGGMIIERTNSGGTITYHNIVRVLSETELTVVSDGNWATTDTYKIPVQLGSIYVIDASSIEDSISADPENTETMIYELYEAESIEWADLGVSFNLGTTPGDEDTPIAYEVHSTVYSNFMLRLMMHMDGFYKSKNGGTFSESDKIRMIWNAAIMDSWLPSARVNSIFDINNVPITNMMTTYNDTTSNDSFGSVLDIRGVTLGSAIAKLQELAGHGSTNGLFTSFSYLIGRDNRFEFRPKFNSGLVLNRDNIRVSQMISDLTGQITNVRVYYNNGNSFVDWPSVNLDDSTRWNILTHNAITSSEEALLVAKQEYNQRQNSPLSLSVTPILESDVEYKMIESGRYGYIADPYIALWGTNDTVANVCNWTLLGTGGVLFPGMVNALDGNMNIDTDPLQDRYGSSRNTNAAGDVEWAHNYYWYGSNSISKAVQIVHIPNKTPVVSDATSQPMRIWVDLKSGQSGTDIDNAEFTISVADYSFSGKARSETISGSIVTKDVKHSGYYEIAFPSNYGAVANAKIVFSFNAEYCRALLRHRCGDPTNANILAQVGTNTDTIFPLGKRVYTEMGGGFRNGRVLWYAPRIHICRDLSYVPATYTSVTDAGLQLSSESMVIQDVLWKVAAGKTEEVSLTLERDESIAAAGLIGYLFPKGSGQRQRGSPIGGGGSDSGYEDGDNNITPPPNTDDAVTDPSEQKPEGGTKDSTGQSYSASKTSRTPLSSSRMNLPNDNLSGDSRFSVLGQNKITSTPSTMRSLEGMDIDIRAVSGTASVTADGYVFGGKALMGGEASAASQEVSIETSFVVPQDILNNRMTIQAYVTHSPKVANYTDAVLYVTVVVEETGETVTNTVKIKSGIRNQIINLLSNKAIKGLRKSGRKIKVTVTRKPGIGDDDANTTSITLHNLDVKMRRASAHTSSSSNKFSYNS